MDKGFDSREGAKMQRKPRRRLSNLTQCAKRSVRGIKRLRRKHALFAPSRSSREIFPSYFRSAAITATVKREMQTSLPASSSMRIDQIWVVRPSASGRAVAVTQPA